MIAYCVILTSLYDQSVFFLLFLLTWRRPINERDFANGESLRVRVYIFEFDAPLAPAPPAPLSLLLFFCFPFPLTLVASSSPSLPFLRLPLLRLPPPPPHQPSGRPVLSALRTQQLQAKEKVQHRWPIGFCPPDVRFFFLTRSSLKQIETGGCAREVSQFEQRFATRLLKHFVCKERTTVSLVWRTSNFFCLATFLSLCGSSGVALSLLAMPGYSYDGLVGLVGY